MSNPSNLPFTPYSKSDFDPVNKGPLLILGNGPSLEYTPLDDITVPSWGMNLISRLWEKIRPDLQWRPDRWWWGDHPQYPWQLQAVFDNVLKFDDCWVREDVAEMLIGHYKPFDNAQWGWVKYPYYENMPYNVVTPWKRCQHHTGVGFKGPAAPREYPHWPADGSLCKPGTTVAVAILQAIKEGYDPLYLAGCDAGFVADGPTHFDPDYYDANVNITPASANWTNLLIEWQHSCLDEWTRENDRRIFNAGIGGSLTAHERVDFSVLT